MRQSYRTISWLSLIFFGLWTISAGQSAWGQSTSTLDRIVGQIEDLFPPVEGTVLSVDGDTLILDLKQGQSIEKGDHLDLIRFGEDLIHPVTKKKIGRKETDLGKVEILQVRRDFSLARVLEPGTEVQPGDGVRSPFNKLAFLVAPAQIHSKKKIDRNRLRLNLENHLNDHPRFEIPVFELQLWLLEKELKVNKLLDPKNLDILRKEVQVDYILIPLVRSVKGSTVLGYKLHSAKDGSLIKQAKVLSDEIPEAPKVSRKDRREQDVQSSFARKADALIKFVGRQELSFEVVDFDIGDINGDGKPEIVMIDRNRVMLFRLVENKLKRIAQVKTNVYGNYFLGVDVGDINGNGRDEIFVTSQQDQSLKSFALEAEPGRKGLRTIWKDVNLYFRILRPFGAKPQLISQKPGFRDPFHGPIRAIEYRGGSYREAGELRLPSKYGMEIILYGLTQTDLNRDGAKETILLDSDYNLRVYSASGRLIVKSNDYYGHDPRTIDVGVKEEIAGLVQQGEPVNFRGRLQFIKKQGKKFLIIPRNHRLGGSFLANAVIVQNSSLVFLSSTDEGFEKVFETKKQKGFLSSYQIMETPGSQSRKVLVVNVEEGGLTSKTRSTLLVYDW